MKTSLWPLLCCVAACSPGPVEIVPDAGAPDAGGATDAGGFAPYRSDVIALVGPVIDAGWLQGLSIALVTPMGIELESFGTDAVSGQPYDEHTEFEVGSITKTFTGALLESMVRDGLVQLDEPVQDLLPSTVTVPARNGKVITLQELASHYSGLPGDATNLSTTASDPFAVYTVDDLYAFLNGYSLTTDPGASFAYSNLGFGLLGHALALKAGTSYEQVVHDRVTAPLGLTDTAITLDDDQKQRLSAGYDGVLRSAPATSLTDALAAYGALRSTAADMALYMRQQLGLEPTPLHDALFDTQKQLFGAGSGVTVGSDWFAASGLIQHDGATAGFLSMVLLDPVKQLGVAVLSNTNSMAYLPDERVAKALMQMLQGQPVTGLSLPVDVTLPTSTLDSYVGTYRLNPSTTVQVARDGERLTFRITGQGRFHVYATTPTDFYTRIFAMTVSFNVDGSGAVTSFTATQAGQQFTATRAP